MCWFHLSRALPGADFHAGIRPLHDQVDAIWEALFPFQDRLDAAGWRGFRAEMERTNGQESRPDPLQSCHSTYLYRLKVLGNRRTHGGPYGMLVRETAFCAKAIANHDYLAGSEICEDISMAFDTLHGYNLLERYCAGSRPCIIKFVDPVLEIGHLHVALSYLYDKSKGQEIHSAVHCFDGHGVAVSPERILGVDYNPVDPDPDRPTSRPAPPPGPMPTFPWRTPK